MHVTPTNADKFSPAKGSQHPGILRIATWNVRGASPSKMPGIYNALEEHGIDVCILTETKWTFATGDGHVLDKRWSAARLPEWILTRLK
jgi:hypothetical protein